MREAPEMASVYIYVNVTDLNCVFCIRVKGSVTGLPATDAVAQTEAFRRLMRLLRHRASLNAFLCAYHPERNYKHLTLNAVATRLLSAVPSQRLFQIKMTIPISRGSAPANVLP